MRFPNLDQSDVKWFEFEWLDDLIPPWAPGRVVEVDDTRRPSAANGFFLECTVAGMTGGREPAWPATPDATKVDGSATWAVRKPEDATIPTIASVSYTITPSGELVEASTDDNDVTRTSRIRIDPTSAALDDYEIEATMTDSNGEDHVQTKRLRIVRAA